MPSPYMARDGLVRVYPGGLGGADSSAQASAGTSAEAGAGSSSALPLAGVGVVWAHGGGFVHGDLDMNEADWVARELSVRGATVVSVDYRRAPALPGWGDNGQVTGKDPYPAASDDMLAAWAWTLDHASDLGIDPERVAIGGASAGGNIAAGAVVRMLEAGDFRLPALALLAYPTLLAVQPAPGPELRAALDANPAADRFGPAAVLAMYENYLGGSVEDAPLGAVPGNASAADLADFPATLMVNGDTDELRVSGEHFAHTLREAGREVEVLSEPGTQHGHLNRPAEPAAAATIARFVTRLADLPVRA